MDEFEIIDECFGLARGYHKSTLLSRGDDAAVMKCKGRLSVSKDMLVEGRHFFPDVDPRKLAIKALNVNLSDMAAVGARPYALLLGIALPRNLSGEWIRQFSKSFVRQLKKYRIDLIGGDTCSSDLLVISVTIIGRSSKRMIRRCDAKEGDDIFVTGKLGLASLGLRFLRGEIVNISSKVKAMILRRLEEPTARVEFMLKSRGFINSAVDISDGLSSDLSHILKASGLGAILFKRNLRDHVRIPGLSSDLLLECILNGGDDYEICFTSHPRHSDRLGEIASLLGLDLTLVGRVTRRDFVFDDGSLVKASGYKHFGV